ncbi:class I SAM-dependent methyltransferase [Terricaulis silvestris]|uniref:Demethylmenaquinone methyltransferase n=1 Tax=Terricaulis silvestris TaxID=2686094 RepID=A0A6I6MXV1_9CAUL|nr:class I SAM-dependent methyltransferase [Terricaulis silvestris]QGZ96472.1 Demethylmenaquinone methyltransferase [Terricaulis silvestris]
MPDKPTQRDYWSGKAGEEWAAYAQRIDVMLAPIADAALAAADLQPGQRVLDIGCGSGATSLEIARRVGASGNVVGVDLSPQLLQVARERASEAGIAADFVEGDAATATFAERFDRAFSRFGVMFFEAPSAAFTHIRGVMQPGGKLAFVCWAPMPENLFATVPIAAIEPMLKAPLPAPDPDAPGPYAFADSDKVKRILNEAAWRDIEVSRWDGEINVGGGGALEDIAAFLLRIGPCSRAIADQRLDAEEAKRRLTDALTPHYRDSAVLFPAACWIVTANA